VERKVDFTKIFMPRAASATVPESGAFSGSFVIASLYYRAANCPPPFIVLLHVYRTVTYMYDLKLMRLLSFIRRYPRSTKLGARPLLLVTSGSFYSPYPATLIPPRAARVRVQRFALTIIREIEHGFRCGRARPVAFCHSSSVDFIPAINRTSENVSIRPFAR